MGIQKKFESIKKSEENIQTCFSGVITETQNIQKQIKELSDKNNIVTSSKFIKAKCSK
jgi:flagellar biosynthesis chaperone FliJ